LKITPVSVKPEATQGVEGVGHEVAAAVVGTAGLAVPEGAMYRLATPTITLLAVPTITSL
jgi:hypothetical protein